MRVPSSGLRIDDPSFPLLQGLISYWGVTTANGAGTGLTIRCGALALEPPYDNHKLKMLSGPSAGQCRDITLHPAGTDTLTVSVAFTNVTGAAQQINAGTLFVVMSDTPSTAEVAALIVLVNAIETKLDTGGLGVGLVTKALVFANNIGQVPLFTVTGDVIVRIVAVVKTNCASQGCNVSVGIAADVDAIIPVTDITLLAAQEIWFDATPDSEIETLGTMREHIISDGNDITLNSSAADNSGAITFYCFWTALSAGASVA